MYVGEWYCGECMFLFLSVEITQHGSCNRTLTCTVNGSNVLVWEANDDSKRLWRSELNHTKSMDIGQGGTANVTLIKAVPCDIMQSTFVLTSPGSLKSLNVTCMADENVKKSALMLIDDCHSQTSKLIAHIVQYVVYGADMSHNL